MSRPHRCVTSAVAAVVEAPRDGRAAEEVSRLDVLVPPAVLAGLWRRSVQEWLQSDIRAGNLEAEADPLPGHLVKQDFRRFVSTFPDARGVSLAQELLSRLPRLLDDLFGRRVYHLAFGFLNRRNPGRGADYSRLAGLVVSGHGRPDCVRDDGALRGGPGARGWPRGSGGRGRR